MDLAVFQPQVRPQHQLRWYLMDLVLLLRLKLKLKQVLGLRPKPKQVLVLLQVAEL